MWTIQRRSIRDLMPVRKNESNGLVMGISKMKTKKNEEKLERLNLVLRTIRNVTHLLVRERDRTRLLQSICNNLIENRGYYNAWIALFDESGGLDTTIEAGFGNEFLPMIERMKGGELVPCCQKALEQSGVSIFEDPISACIDCPLSTYYTGRAGMTVRLEFDGKVYGTLTVSTPRNLSSDEEERALFEEIAGDIAFAMHGIEIKEKRKLAENALQASEKTIRQIFQGSSIPTFVIDNKHIITHWNRACENLTGISSKEIIGTQRQWSAFYSIERPVLADLIVDNSSKEEIDEYYKDKCRKSDVIEGGYEAEDFFPILGERGKWLSFTVAPLRDSEGKITGAIETLQDVTQLKETNEALRKSLHKLGERVKEQNCLYEISRLVEKQDISLDEIFQGIVNFIPPAWQYPEIICARIILEDQEFKTKNFEETKWKQVQDIIVQGNPRGTLEVDYKEKRPERNEGPFLKEERDLLNAIAERVGRIIERKQSEEALRESEQLFRDLVENSLIGISIIQDNRIVYQNPEQEKLIGPLPRPIMLTDLSSIHPEDAEKVKEFYRDITAGNTQTQDIDFRFYPPGNMGSRHDMKWFYCRTSLIEYQREKAILVTFMDMTRAKELEHLLRIQDKMASLGRVAAGIAHEIRNPLSGINIYLNTLEKIYDRAESFDKVKAIIEHLQSASAKIESVIRRVMDFSKPSEPRLILTTINEPIEEAFLLSTVTLRKRGIKVEKTLLEDLPPFHLDPHMIEEVILNLINNAAEAMKNMDDEKVIALSSSMENNRIIVRVSDSGPGVSLNRKDTIFDPFYSTKNGSTGIGLSLSHRIITDHGGSLSVSQSKLGGAEFMIEIPIKNQGI